MPIFPTPIDLDADYQWAGLHTFEFIATFEGGIETEQITSTVGLTTTLASGGQGQYYFGANPIYLMSATEFRPAEALTAVTLGSATRRWTNVYSVDGSFSGTVTLDEIDSVTSSLIVRYSGAAALDIGSSSRITCYLPFVPDNNGTKSSGLSNRRWSTVYSVDGSFTGNLDTEVGGSNRLFNLGSDGDTDTEYLETSWDTNKAYILTKATGAGTQRDLYIGDSTGASNTLIQGGAVRLYDGTTLMQNVDSLQNTMYKGVRPNADAVVPLGYSGRRWSSVASVDADFSGNIKAENLPTSDPGVPGQFYVTTGGALKVSQ